MAVNPTSDQIEQLVADAERLTGEVVMLNLLKFSETAGDGEGGTGQDSYGRYAATAIQKVTERGGHVVWMGSPDSIVIGDDVVGDWDVVLLVSYPNRQAFLDMVGDPEYQASHKHREGGLERMALVAMTPGEGFGSTSG
jgi:uncharacterized protein (DUF1330 family)